MERERGVRGGGWKGEAVRSGVKTSGVVEVLMVEEEGMLPLREDGDFEEEAV